MQGIIIAVFLVLGTVAAQRIATVTLSGDPGVKGVIKFTEVPNGIEVEGRVEGLTKGNHGFHIHQYGDLSNGCASTGSHFNPHNLTHGAPEDEVRHVGDLGNIVADDTGVAVVSKVDKVISLTGEHCIIGRAVVVHTGEDDLGRGNSPDSKTTGNAGGRVACGIIGRLF